MLVIVRCVIYDGDRTTATTDASRPQLPRVHEGEVLAAWRAIEDRTGIALLSITSTAVIPTLLDAAFPNARHIHVEDVLSVKSVTDVSQRVTELDSSDDSHRTGS